MTLLLKEREEQKIFLYHGFNIAPEWKGKFVTLEFNSRQQLNHACRFCYIC